MAGNVEGSVETVCAEKALCQNCACCIDTNTVTTEVLGKEIVVHISRTEEGINLLIAGGDKSHIGAVAIVNPDGELSCITFQTHKDGIIAEKWCKELWNRYKVQAVVSVGIHYDDATREMIEEILNKTDRMMEVLLNE